MKLMTFVGASLIALAAPALAAQSATTITGSKSNSDERIDPRDPDAERKCAMAGGKVTSQDGAMICVLPDTGAPRATTLASSKSNSSERIGDTGAPAPLAAEATTITSSKSNADSRIGNTGSPMPLAAEATTVDNTKSNTYRIDPRDPDAERKCDAQGGTLSRERDGSLVCTISAAAD
ncbi:MAG: hypothetical protein ACLGHC_10015 [Alphaproteobacteria bacterium]